MAVAVSIKPGLAQRRGRAGWKWRWPRRRKLTEECAVMGKDRVCELQRRSDARRWQRINGTGGRQEGAEGGKFGGGWMRGMGSKPLHDALLRDATGC